MPGAGSSVGREPVEKNAQLVIVYCDATYVSSLTLVTPEEILQLLRHRIHLLLGHLHRGGLERTCIRLRCTECSSDPCIHTCGPCGPGGTCTGLIVMAPPSPRVTCSYGDLALPENVDGQVCFKDPNFSSSSLPCCWLYGLFGWGGELRLFGAAGGLP